MTATLDVNVNPRGAVSGSQVAEAALGRLGVKATQVERSLLSLGSASNRVGLAFQALTAGFVAGNILKASDAYTVVQNRLKLVTGSAEELGEVYEKVFDVAQRTRAPLEATAKFYSQLSLNSKELGLTQEKTLRITETLNKIIALTGQSAEASSNALIQLQQAMGSGALRGDELRSIMEQLPMLAQIIASKMGATVGTLKDLGEAGAITSQIVADALLASSDEIDKAFAKTTFTFSQAFIVLQNGFVNFIGKMNEATGVFNAMTKAIAWVGKEFDTLAVAVFAFGGALGAVKLIAWVNMMNQAAVSLVTFRGGIVLATGSMTGFQLALARITTAMAAARASMIAFMMSNPFTAALTALLLVMPLLYNFRDSIKLTADGSVTLGTVFTWVMDTIKAGLPIVIDMFTTLVSTVWNLVTTFTTAVMPAFQAFLTAMQPVVTVVNDFITAVTGSSANLTTFSMIVTAIIAKFNPWLALLGAILALLNQWDPGLKKVTFAVQAFGEAVGLLIRVALTPILGIFHAIVQVMGAFGLVSQETVVSVQNAIAKFLDFGAASAEAEARLRTAYDEMQKGNTTTQTAVTKTGELAKVAGDKLAPAFQTTADTSGQLAKNTGDAATSTANLASSSDTAAVSVEKSARQMKLAKEWALDLKVSLDEVAESYNKVANAKARAGMGGDLRGGGIDGQRAAGGPVRGGGRYLVGENGPELFVPRTSGTIIPNGAAKEIEGVTRRGSEAPTMAVAKAIKNVAYAIDGLAEMSTFAKQNETAFVSTAKALESTNTNLKKMAVAYTDAKSFQYTPTDFGSLTPDASMIGSPRRLGRNYRVGTNVMGEDAWMTAAEYQDWMKENMILPGDANYKSNPKWQGNRSGMIAYDAAMPFSGEIGYARQQLSIAQATMDRFGGVVEGSMRTKLRNAISGWTKKIQELVAAQEATIQKLRDARAAMDAFSQFKKQIPAMMAEKSSVDDFQTKWGFQGGTDVPDTGKSLIKESKSKDMPPIVININGAKDIQSYRRNMADIEAGMLAMVKRAQRRANS